MQLLAKFGKEEKVVEPKIFVLAELDEHYNYSLDIVVGVVEVVVAGVARFFL